MERSFTYGVSALGNKGGDRTISLLKTQLQQVMEQIFFENIQDFPKRSIQGWYSTSHFNKKKSAP